VISARRFSPETRSQLQSAGAPGAGGNSDRVWLCHFVFRARSRRPRIAESYQGRHLRGRQRLDQGQYRDVSDWPTIGLDYAETRFSKLNRSTPTNVKSSG